MSCGSLQRHTYLFTNFKTVLLSRMLTKSWEPTSLKTFVSWYPHYKKQCHIYWVKEDKILSKLSDKTFCMCSFHLTAVVFEICRILTYSVLAQNISVVSFNISFSINWTENIKVQCHCWHLKPILVAPQFVPFAVWVTLCLKLKRGDEQGLCPNYHAG